VQSLIAVEPVTTSADKQASKDDPQRVAARIAVWLREAGYLCVVLESRRLQTLACNRDSSKAADVGCHAPTRGVRMPACSVERQ